MCELKTHKELIVIVEMCYPIHFIVNYIQTDTILEASTDNDIWKFKKNILANIYFLTKRGYLTAI